MKSLEMFCAVVFLTVSVVSTSANAAVVYITEDNLSDYSYIVGDGTVEVVDTTSAVGTASDLSLELIWPTNSDDAGIQITDLGSPLISSVDSWDYWVKAPEWYNPHLTMFLDTDENGIYDTEARISTYNIGHGNEWFNIDNSGTISFWVDPEYGSAHSYDWTWVEFQAIYGTALVKEIRISHYGYYIGDTGITTHLDDFSFGDTDYVICVPEPTTVALLFLGGFFLTLRKKR